jgi:hypothetical protein
MLATEPQKGGNIMMRSGKNMVFFTGSASIYNPDIVLPALSMEKSSA